MELKSQFANTISNYLLLKDIRFYNVLIKILVNFFMRFTQSFLAIYILSELEILLDFELSICDKKKFAAARIYRRHSKACTTIFTRFNPIVFVIIYK